jgi:hypothetical protein
MILRGSGIAYFGDADYPRPYNILTAGAVKHNFGNN